MKKSDLTTLYEHEYTENFDWSEKDLLAVMKVNSEAGVEILNPTVRSGKKELKATEQVGVIKFRNRSVQILPKIYRPDNSKDKDRIAREASRNLLKLLSYVGDFSFNESDLNSLLNQKNDWFEILIHLFSTHLHEEWRKGAYRNYRETRDDLPVLKGRWLISEQLKRPSCRTAFAVEYDEFSPDNRLNRVFRFVVERLFQITSDNRNKRKLNELRSFLSDVGIPAQMTREEAETINLSRINARFAPLLNLAKFFLDNSVMQLSHGAVETFSFVFDMNRLFEAFIAEFIRRHKSSILEDGLADCGIFPQGGGTGNSLFLAHHGKRNFFRLKPDIVFRLNDDTFPLILDTKYKLLKEERGNLGISPSDFYQMQAYARRYQSPRVILLYPQTIGMPVPVRRTYILHDGNAVIKAATVNMQMDLCSRTDRQVLISELKEIIGGNEEC